MPALVERILERRDRSIRTTVCHFRGTHHSAPHDQLVSKDTFDATSRLLEVRGESRARRVSDYSDYLLAGLLVCDKCGHPLLGNAAHSKGRRYKYYTCFSRNRYGREACDSRSLPAEILELRVLEAMLDTYADSDAIQLAIQDVCTARQAKRRKVADQLAALVAEIRKAEETMERYFSAFESGAMKEEVCAALLDSLSQKLTELRRSRDELQETMDSTDDGSSDIDVTALGELVREAVEQGTPAEQKNLLRNLVAEIRVKRPDDIQPYFRIPQNSEFRVLTRMVDPAVQYSNTERLIECPRVTPS